MEELTKFVTGQFQKNLNEKSFKDILKTDDGKKVPEINSQVSFCV